MAEVRCYVCLDGYTPGKGDPSQYRSGVIDDVEYEGGVYHDECALAVGMPEELMA